MTMKEALDKLEADRRAIEQALSGLQTVKSFQAVGEEEKAFALYAAVRANLRQQLSVWPPHNQF